MVISAVVDKAQSVEREGSKLFHTEWRWTLDGWDPLRGEVERLLCLRSRASKSDCVVDSRHATGFLQPGHVSAAMNTAAADHARAAAISRVGQ